MISPGDYVKAGYQGGPMSHVGIVTSLEKMTHRDAGTETLVYILSEGILKLFCLQEDNIEVIKHEKNTNI